MSIRVDKANFNFSNMRENYNRNMYSPRKQAKKDNSCNSEFQEMLSNLLKIDKINK